MLRHKDEKVKMIIRKLKSLITMEEIKIDSFVRKDCGYKTGNVLPVPDGTWEDFKNGDIWYRKKDSHCWFYSKISVPEDDMYLSLKTSRLHGWDYTNPQFLVYINSKITQGADLNHNEVRLGKRGEYEVHIYAHAGNGDGGPLQFFPALYKEDELTRKMYYDLLVPYEICSYLSTDGEEYIKLLTAISEAADFIDFRKVYSEEYYSSIQKASDFLDEKFSGDCKVRTNTTVIAIGHTHIDVAWLWPLAQTREKVLRSFATVVHLMKLYPDYVFMSSQAQLYKYLKEESPELYSEVKGLVREGRWEVEGAMWVEADCNLTSGESLVRQILFGKRFFKEEFGINSHILWLPDVFGYSASLPQILKKSGVDIFVTSKISWNDTNLIPFDTFYWTGIDGTEIFSYFLTAQEKKRDKKPDLFTTYTAKLNPAQIAGAWDRYQNKDFSEEVLHTFGFGDGGGGPTEWMLENAKRLKKGIIGCPSVKIEKAGDFLCRIKNKADNSNKVPKWVGELYLERHRGTYTSQAKNKKYNRKSEFLYQTAEWISSVNKVLMGAEYPQKKLNDGWETILLNQFHDIIPGSSVNEVYVDSHRQYEEIIKEADGIISDAFNVISDRINTDGGLLVFNPLAFCRSGTAKVDGKTVYVENIPSKGYAVTSFKEANTIKASENLLENKFFRLGLENGEIVSVYDKENDREIVPKGRITNEFVLYEDDCDKGIDAWEVNGDFKDKMYVIGNGEFLGVSDDGVRKGIKIKRNFGKSEIVQTVWLYDDIARIDFETNVDWHEQHYILKAKFPADVFANSATCDIQFGSVSRATHENTSWDRARFEICAQKYVDVSEDDYGVSLLNDSKYGYDVSGSEISITLLKGSIFPDPLADKGEHNFTYSLYPHKGNHKNGGTITMAYDLNVPLCAIKKEKQTGTLSESYSFVHTDSENVIIDTVKKAEDTDSIVIRMYEAFGRRTKAKINFGFHVKKAYLSDLCENTTEEIKVFDNGVNVQLMPFEILTLILEL